MAVLAHFPIQAESSPRFSQSFFGGKLRSINRFYINGNIGTITRFEKSLKLNVATNRSWVDSSGERKEATDWVQLSVLDERQATYLAETAKVGDIVFAEGRISAGSYQRNGETVYTTDLITSTVNLFPKQS